MTKSSKILIVGIDSMLGSMAARHFDASGQEWIGTSRRGGDPNHLFLDLLVDMDRWEIPGDVSAACIFAGVTRIQECENDPELAYRVNVEGTAMLTRRLLEHGIFVVFPSSNFVFDGITADVHPNTLCLPTMNYGRHQVEIEKVLASYAERTAILRLSKVLIPEFPLLAGWVTDLCMGNAITAFRDLWMAPVTAGAIMDVITRICRERTPGTFQMSGREDISYAEAALYLAGRLGVAESLVQAVLGAERGLSPMMLRRRSTLDCSLTSERFGFERPEPRQVLDAIFDFHGEQLGQALGEGAELRVSR